MPSRVADVIREHRTPTSWRCRKSSAPDPSGAGQAEEIGAALGMGWVMASVRHLRNHLFGNVVLSRFPIVHHSQYDLSWRTCEPRACQRADLDLGDGRMLHIYNVHLGTAVLERRYQAPRLAAFVHDRRVEGPKIILGDFNEWMRGLATKTLSSLFESIDICGPPEAAPHVSRDLSGAPPRSHLLRGPRRGPRRRAARTPQGADGVRPPAARRRSARSASTDVRRTFLRLPLDPPY